METKRFEQLGTRLRTIRQEEVERKKETQIKLTDKLPASKRARTCACICCSDPKPLVVLKRFPSKGVHINLRHCFRRPGRMLRDYRKESMVHALFRQCTLRRLGVLPHQVLVSSLRYIQQHLLPRQVQPVPVAA